MNKRCPKCNSANIYEVAFMCDIEDNKELWVFACDDCKYGGFYEEKIKIDNEGDLKSED